MLDKLYLSSDKPIGMNTIKELINTPSIRYSTPNDTIYNYCFSFFNLKGINLATVKIDPKSPYASNSAILTNPSHFESFLEFSNFISRLHNLDDLIIRRIDFAVDINVPLSDIRNSLIVKGKRRRFDYGDRDRNTGFEIGKGNEVIVVYDKGYQISKRRTYKRNKGIPLDVITRIEVRHTKNKVTHNSFSDLPLYLELNPFSKLEFYKLNQSSDDALSDQKRRALDTLLSRDGLHSLYKNLNIHNNFKRNYSSYFRGTSFPETIIEIYTSNLSSFFGASV